MKLALNIIFLLVIVYYCYKFIFLLVKMRGNVVLPITEDEAHVFWRLPQKPVGLPKWSKQKTGIIVFLLMLVYMIVTYCFAVFDRGIALGYYLLMFIPLLNSHNLFNIFVVKNDGIVSGNQFIRYKHMKSFKFVPIDANHMSYGFSKEVNEGYELKVEGKTMSTTCIVTSEEMKARLTEIFEKEGVRNVQSQ